MAIRSSDQISIVDLTDGYSVMLTNDSHTFLGDTTKAIAASTETTVIAMCGASQVAASVNLDDVVKPTGVNVTKDTDATQPTLTIAVTTAVTAGGTVDIPVQLDNGNITIHKLFTFQIAFKGSPGAAGTSAQWYTGTAITGTSTTATIFSGSGISNAKVGDMYLNTSTQNTYRCTVGGAASVAKWVYVSNIKGATGGTGPAGADAITMSITSSNGTIFKNTGVSTTLTAHVYRAGAELSATQIAELGTIKWYKDGSTTPLSTTGATLNINASDVINKASYIAQLEG
jgi:hypothetical protein